jgi:hypothetical protein
LVSLTKEDTSFPNASKIVIVVKDASGIEYLNMVDGLNGFG